MPHFPAKNGEHTTEKRASSKSNRVFEGKQPNTPPPPPKAEGIEEKPCSRVMFEGKQPQPQPFPPPSAGEKEKRKKRTLQEGNWVFEGKQRIIQEFVPGRQVTLAHLIANPNQDLYKKLGVICERKGALGILTITPGEAAIIAADVATKAAEVEIVFVDRFSGAVVVCGDVASVEAALKDVLEVLEKVMQFTPTVITRS